MTLPEMKELQRSTGADDGVDKRPVLADGTGEVVRTQRQIAEDDIDKRLRRGGELDVDRGLSYWIR